MVQGDASAPPYSGSRGSLAGLGPVTAWERKGDVLGRGAAVAAAPRDWLTPGSHTGTGREEQPAALPRPPSSHPNSADGDALVQRLITSYHFVLSHILLILQLLRNGNGWDVTF